MLDFSKGDNWKRALENDQQLMELARKAGLVDNPKRAQELNGCIAWNGGEGVIKSEAEEELAIYMFCMTEKESFNESLQQRILMAKAAGETDL